jgi:exodeoxyribonuclease-5
MVNELVKQIPVAYDKRINCSAPTNKAVAVLKGKVDELSNLDFVTTHSALKLKRHINFKTGDISFQPSFDKKYPPLKTTGLFVVDEASMLSQSLVDYIEEYATVYNVKVIFIGDEKQLNPVNEEHSPVFHQGYPEVELTEIIRQGNGNPIIDLSRNLPSIGKGISMTNTEMTEGYVYSNNKPKVIEELARVNGTDELKYLAWTNKEVDTMNFLVRRAIYGNPKKIEVGETLVFNAPYKELYFTNEEMKVKEAIVREKDFQFVSNKMGEINPGIGDDPYFGTIKLKYYSVNPGKTGEFDLFTEQNIVDRIIVIHEDSEKDYKKIVKLLKDKAKIADIDWKDYYQFVEQFADLKYNHAITVHKSQGSTYKQAIVNVKNLNMNRNKIEKNRLLYTAITRASELLILYNY